MSYMKMYGNYGIYTDNMVFKWFKDLDNAMKYWKENIVSSPEVTEEWLEEYDSISIRDIKTGEVVVEL